MATLAFLRTVVNEAGENTGEFECSACGLKFRPDRGGSVQLEFIAHRLERHPVSHAPVSSPDAPRIP